MDRLDSRLQLLTRGPRDRPARHQTMRAAIAWSYDLLAPEEQTLLRAMSVFTGGCTLDAVERVMGDGSWGLGNDEPDPTSPSVLDALAALVDKSLVRYEPVAAVPRYGLLETVREFGREQLAARGEEAEAGRRHAAWCLTLAETERERYYTADEPAAMDRLTAEHPNLRAALGWFVANDELEAGLRLAAALAWFWHSRGPAGEGHDWLERLLAQPADIDPAIRADALTGAALLAWTVREFARAAELLDAAVPLWRRLGDRPGLVRALNFAALVANARHDLAGEVAANEEAVAVARAVGDPLWLALSLGSLGHMLARQGDVTGALAALDEDLTLLRTIGYERGMGWALEGLGENALAHGDCERAQAHYREALALAWNHRTLSTVAIELGKLAAALAAGGQPDQAVRLFGAAAALRETIGALPTRKAAFDDERQTNLLAVVGAERFAAAWAAGHDLPLETTIANALGAPTGEPRVSLTPREAQIMPLLAAGRTNPQIAAALFLSPRTIQNHVARLFAKLGVRSRAAAVDAARAAGLLP